jgi:hypothetical protein
MKDIDFTACPFIKEQLCFLTYTDFCHNAKLLKIIFEGLDKDAKTFYKWYIYANIHMDEYFKNLIWEYLNTDEISAYINLIDSLHKYRVR